MIKRTFLALFILSALICCMGQTFQYSRGWTNGKRSNSHLFEDSVLPEMIEMDTQRKLEKCLISLQRISRNPFSGRLQQLPIAGSGRHADRHQQVPDMPEELDGMQGLMKGQA